VANAYAKMPLFIQGFKIGCSSSFFASFYTFSCSSNNYISVTIPDINFCFQHHLQSTENPYELSESMGPILKKDWINIASSLRNALYLLSICKFIELLLN